MRSIVTIALLSLTLAGCEEKKTLSASVRQSARMAAIKVTGSEDAPRAVFESTVGYGLTAGTETTNELPDSLGVEVALQVAKSEVQGKALEVQFGKATGLKPGADKQSAVWSTTIANKEGVPTQVEVVVAGEIKDFDSSKVACGTKVPVVLASKWSVKLDQGDWKLDGNADGTTEEKLEAYVDCTGLEQVAANPAE